MMLRLLLGASAAIASAATPPQHLEGHTDSGAAYVIDMPRQWNGTLLLWSHGYAPVSPPPEDAPRDLKSWLLDQGYALAGSSYSRAGWALAQAVPDQLATVAVFRARIAAPKRTIAWGQSMGGLVTVALAERHPDVISAALPMCGSLAGSIGMMNEALAGAFAFVHLAAPDAGIRLVGVTDDRANAARVQAAVAQAMTNAQGRARLALAATLAQLPHWSDPAASEPDPSDYDAILAQQARTFAMGVFLPRSDQERLAGGVFSWTQGVDFADLLRRSGESAYVEALYRRAGLSLQDDLKALSAASAIRADPAAVRYMAANYSPTGEVRVPVLAMHTTGDGLTVPNNLIAYATAVNETGASRYLRELAVHSAGHCAFAPAEIAAGLKALERRLDQGRWSITPAALEEQEKADGLGPTRFRAADFGAFLRPYVPPRRP